MLVVVLFVLVVVQSHFSALLFFCVNILLFRLMLPDDFFFLRNYISFIVFSHFYNYKYIYL